MSSDAAAAGTAADHRPTEQAPRPASDAELEATARRLLGLDAAYGATLAAALVVAAGPVADHVMVPRWLVRSTGLAIGGAAGAVAVSSVGENWIAITRRVAWGNVGLAAGMLGLAAARRGPGGVVAGLVAVAPIGGLAYRQLATLVEQQGPVIA